MKAEIIAIGSELTTGAKLDTNSQWLSLALADHGISVHFHQTMADELAEMVAVLRTAAARSDLVLITGGLGPTQDDLTRHAMAEFAGVELQLHQTSLDVIREMFSSRGRTMPERNVVQAMFPVGSEPLPNSRGTAPGVWLEHDGCRLAAMPGVPSEMKVMFRQRLLPRLPLGSGLIRRALVHCYGAGESHIEEMLGDLTTRGGDPDVGITASKATITLRINAHGGTEDECQAKIDRVSREIRGRLGDLVFGEGDDELQHAVVRMLDRRGLTLSVAESGTGGLLSHWLTTVPEFQSAFLGGLVVPTDAAKTQLLQVDEDALATAGPVSEQVVKTMAANCRQCFRTDFALAISEDAPTNDSEPPHVWLAVAGAFGERAERLVHVGDPELARARAAKSALNMLRLRLLKCGQPGNA